MINNSPKFGRDRGRLAKATRAWADSLRVDGKLPGSAAILVELARDAANLADGARRAEDGRLYLSAATRLEALMTRAERAVAGDRGRGASRDDGDDLADELGAGPEGGDAADG